MASSQDLVPTGLPYGERQKVVAQMQAADVPTSSEGGGGPVPALASAPPPSAAPAPIPRRGPDLSGYDALANATPTPNYQPVPRRQVMYEQVRQSNNQVMQQIFERMDGYKEG